MNARLSLLPLVVGAALLFGAGCDNASVDDDPARLRVIHAAAGEATIDFYIDFDLFASSLTFREASPYIQWEPGLRRLEVRTQDNGAPVSTSREVLLEPGLAYTVLVAASGVSDSIVLIEDDRRLPPSGQMQLRVVHAARQAGVVQGSVVPQAGGDAVLAPTGLAFGSATEAATADAGVYDFAFSSSQNAANLLGQSLEAGRRYLAVVAHVGATSNISLFLAPDG